MNTYNITLKVDNVEHTQRWSGYTDKVAIAQAFIYNAQNGARAIEVISIEEIGTNKVLCMNCKSLQLPKHIDYLGDSEWRCPNCK